MPRAVHQDSQSLGYKDHYGQHKTQRQQEEGALQVGQREGLVSVGGEIDACATITTGHDVTVPLVHQTCLHQPSDALAESDAPGGVFGKEEGQGAGVDLFLQHVSVATGL